MNAYELADWFDKDGLVGNMLRQQADRIAELEKNLHMIQRHYDQLNTQTKPFSDEEIHKLAKEHLRTQNQDGHLVVLGLEDFARAILRKAQEK